MRAVIQRVARAAVHVDGTIVGQIQTGLLVLLGVAQGDNEADGRYLEDKIVGLRVFSDEQGKMNRSLADVHGAVLLVSQFTLLARTAGGRRPSFDDAAPPGEAKRLYEQLAEHLRARGVRVETGTFGAHMAVELVNEGPVTFVLDSREGRTTRGT
jgi:D-tyrosyl-tRNA(Tyr) deacylase